jgi:hypothetical protein
MDFDTKASNIIFQMKIFFQQNDFFQHTYGHLNEKLVYMFFVESHESNFSLKWYNQLNTSSNFAILLII